MATLLDVGGLATYFYTRSGLVRAVDGVSYDVAEGEIVALVGESGCGKTVSVLSLLRIHPQPQAKIVAGEAIWRGEQDLLRVSEAELRHIRGAQISMIFQEPMTSLNPVLTIGQQICEAMECHLGLNREAARHRCLELLTAVAIADPERTIDGYPHELSGGMRQRVMVAMALSCNPRLIIADEPTTAVDVTIQAQILELMATLVRERGVAMILVTHNLGIVARYAQRVNIMYAGHLVERGTSTELYDDPKHPYTISLMQCVPRLDQKRDVKLNVIQGEPPVLTDLVPGCPFQPRCSYATEYCRQHSPPLRWVSDSRQVACWQDLEV